MQGCYSSSTNAKTSPFCFWVPSSQIFTKVVHFVYDFSAFVHSQGYQAIKSTHLICIEIRAFESTHSLAGYQKLHMNCWYPAPANGASSSMDVLLTNWLRGTTVLLPRARAHWSSCQGQAGRSISRLLQKLRKLKQQNYKVLPLQKHSPP